MIDFKDKIVLLTGGTGSFGNFLARRILNSGVKELRIFSRDEKKQFYMKNLYDRPVNMKFFVGDIRDASRVNEVMINVDIVYHAAALKQVLTMEEAPFEGVKTNILGTQNIIDSALNHCVKKVISISTDKAVKPISVMGMTKALQERLMIGANLSTLNIDSTFSIVRFGNVLNSSGSVVPTFKRLLEAKKPLTITHPEMTRFLLTFNQAVDLIFFATQNMNGGETYVKKVLSTYILDLAKVLSKQYNRKLDYNIIGKYPGEKIHEILITEEELNRTRSLNDYFIINPWWEKAILTDISDEYNSKNVLIQDQSIIGELLQRSELEFTQNFGSEKGLF